MTYILHQFTIQPCPHIEPAQSIEEGAWLFIGNHQGRAVLRAVLPQSESLHAYFPEASDVESKEAAGTVTEIILGTLQ